MRLEGRSFAGRTLPERHTNALVPRGLRGSACQNQGIRKCCTEGFLGQFTKFCDISARIGLSVRFFLSDLVRFGRMDIWAVAVRGMAGGVGGDIFATFGMLVTQRGRFGLSSLRGKCLARLRGARERAEKPNPVNHPARGGRWLRPSAQDDSAGLPGG